MFHNKGVSVLPEVDHHLLGILHIDAKFVFAPFHLMFYSLFVLRLIVVRSTETWQFSESSHRSAEWTGGAQQTALRGSSAEGDGGGDRVVDPDCLWSVGQEVREPVPQSWTQAKNVPLLHQVL